MEQIKQKDNLPVVGAREFNLCPTRYELRNGTLADTPLCLYGNMFNWIGYDKEEMKYVRFTKSVFKKLINKLDGKSV